MKHRTEKNFYKLAEKFYNFEHSEDGKVFNELEGDEKSRYIYWLKKRIIKRIDILIGDGVFTEYFSEGRFYDPKILSSDVPFEEIKFKSREQKEYYRNIFKALKTLDHHRSKYKEILNNLEKAEKNKADINEITRLKNKAEKLESLIKKDKTEWIKSIKNKVSNRLNKIDNFEVNIYYAFLKIMNPQNYPGINLLRNLKSNKWEVINKEDRKLLLMGLKLTSHCPNWEDIKFNYDEVEEKINNPIKYRALNQLSEIYSTIRYMTSFKDISEEYLEEFTNKVLKRTNNLYKEAMKIKKEHPHEPIFY